MVKLGNDIKRLRLEKGYTQKQVAEKMGVNGPTVSKWEKTLRLPSVEMLIKVAQLYDVSLYYLLGIGEAEKQIDFDNMSKEQSELLFDLISDFENEDTTELTDTRQSLLGKVLKEFDKVNKEPD